MLILGQGGPDLEASSRNSVHKIHYQNSSHEAFPLDPLLQLPVIQQRRCRMSHQHDSEGLASLGVLQLDEAALSTILVYCGAGFDESLRVEGRTPDFLLGRSDAEIRDGTHDEV